MVPVEPLAPVAGVAPVPETEMMLVCAVAVITVMIVEIVLVPSLIVIEYWPAAAGATPASEITSTAPLASVESRCVTAE
jgi:hypothetical protein